MFGIGLQEILGAVEFRACHRRTNEQLGENQRLEDW
jgi:hypothetical protein